MNLGSRHKPDPSFNMSSMTDVVFLLLIFFMLTSQNVTPSGIPLILPSNSKPLVEISKVEVSVTKDLKYYVNGEESSFESLSSTISNKLNTDPQRRKNDVVMVSGDISVEYGKIMEVVNLAGKLTPKVTLVTKPE